MMDYYVCGDYDDIAGVVVAKALEEVTKHCNNTIKEVKVWLRSLRITKRRLYSLTVQES